MHKKIRSFSVMLGMALAAFTAPQGAWAFSTSQYASTSKLASGKWVKIQVSESGVHEITAQELAQMGFSDINAVRVYGNGGNMISETLDGSAPDDLKQVPVARYSGKLCFYAKGPVKYNLVDPTKSTVRFTRTINAYSTSGYYFLTDQGGDLQVNDVPAPSEQGSNGRSTSLDWFYHEQELSSVSQTGKDLLGESFADGQLVVPYNLRNLCPDSSITVNPSVAALITKDGTNAQTTATSYVRAYLEPNGFTQPDTVKFLLSTSKIYEPSNVSYIFYNQATTYAAVKPTQHSDAGNLRLGFNNVAASVSWARLDYLLLTYWHRNAMANADNAQIRMSFPALYASDRVDISYANNTTHVWCIDDESSPVNYALVANGSAYSFTPGQKVGSSRFVAFDPTKTLLKITGYQQVENQNLHALANPDMVILTSHAFVEQASRIAQLHRQRDGFTVHVIEQDKVFNEFSSGTPDAMAVRLMNKMFYDRNPQGYRYFLLLGCGSYDNRGIATDKANRVITYQTNNSNDDTQSTTCDDFFGFLDDNSGQNVAVDQLRLGVGRIPCATVEEAKSDVDKLITYVTNPDYGPWRNNVMLTADEGDNDMHVFQAEGVGNIMLENSAMFVDKSYVDMYPKANDLQQPGLSDNRRTATEARRHMVDMFQRGQYFATYVGHAGPSHYTKYAKLWTMTDVNTVSYGQFPVMTTACCDVARYDSDTRGIAELMFHNTKGGAIALFTAGRAVISDSNDALNQAFIKALYPASDNGENPRLGDAYKAAKLTFGTSRNQNKLAFMLLGDPAMEFVKPRANFKITTVNGTTLGDSTVVNVRALDELTVQAQVIDPATGNVDDSFTGTAVLTLFDRTTKWKDVTRVGVTRSVYYPRNILAQVTGTVTNGQFTGSLVIPRNTEAQWESALVNVYAHKTGTSEMVNGEYSLLNIRPASTSVLGSDTEAPEVASMFFNDATSFHEGDVVPPTSTLYITATDNSSISVQTASIGNGLTLKLDGGATSYTTVKDFATLTDGGKTLSIVYPMSGLSSGEHTLTFEVSDVYGNTSSRTITFTVGNSSGVSLELAQTPVIGSAQFNMVSNTNGTPSVTVKVADVTGKVIWSKNTTSFPLQWDLKANDGTKLKPGFYKFFGTYETDSEYGGIDAGELVVIEDYKSNK